MTRLLVYFYNISKRGDHYVMRYKNIRHNVKKGLRLGKIRIMQPIEADLYLLF